MKLNTETLTEVRQELATQDKVRIPVPEGLECDGIEVTHIEFNLSYDKGGDYRNRPRGFYLSVQPVEVRAGTVRSVPMNGVRGFVSPEPITRVSKAARQAALDMIDTDVLERYLEHVS